MLRAASLEALPNLRHAFFTRHGGASGGLYASLNGGIGSHDEPENVRENRARMVRALGAEHLVTAYQVHSPHVVVADQAWTRENAPRADAVVTRTRSLAVGITTADCGPVLLADSEAQVIGAVSLAQPASARASAATAPNRYAPKPAARAARPIPLRMTPPVALGGDPFHAGPSRLTIS